MAAENVMRRATPLTATALALMALPGAASADGQARGRPVGVAVDAKGGLLVADDVGNVIWWVTANRD